jgi:hypothetical protein
MYLNQIASLVTTPLATLAAKTRISDHPDALLQYG